MLNGGEQLRAQLTQECRSRKYGMYFCEVPLTAAAGVGAVATSNVQFQRGEYFLWTGLVVTDVRGVTAVSSTALEVDWSVTTDAGDTRNFPNGPTVLYTGNPNNYPDLTQYVLFSENDLLTFTARQRIARNRYVQFSLFGIIYVR